MIFANDSSEKGLISSGSNLRAHQQRSGSKNYGTFTQWNSMQQKEGAYTLCNNMDGIGEDYAN